MRNEPTSGPKQQLAVRIATSLVIEAKVLAARQRCRLNNIVEEALQDLFKKHRDKPKAKWAWMRKDEIARRIHQEARISEDEAASLLDWILDLLKATLQQGEPITILNFGKFTVRRKAPRPGRNPRTSETIMIAARRVVTFSASPQLKAEVNRI
jgi:integration host factor subunit alpha